MGMFKKLTGKKWFSVENKGESRGKINILDDIGRGFLGIGGYTAKDFHKELDKLGAVDNIDVHINSRGGDVFEGFAVYEMLRSHKATIHVKIEALAASIASIIAMAGDEITIAANGFIMTHQPTGFVAGNAKEMRKAADVMDQFKEKIIDTYTQRSNLERSKIERMVNEETWIDAKQAIEMGLADKSTEEVKIAALLDHDYSIFNSLPPALAEQLHVDDDDEEDDEEELPDPEENQMDEAAVKAMLDSALAPIQSKLTDTEAALVLANAKNVEIEKKLAAKAGETFSNNVLSRLNNCVSQSRMLPTERESFLNLVDSLPQDKVEAFVSSVEKRTPTINSHLTREVVTGKGERKSIVLDRAFTAPIMNSEGGVKGPRAEDIAAVDELMSTSKNFEEFRRNAFAAAGQTIHNVNLPFSEEGN
jgi:ATP-dependent Clp protease protease subunit